jgi:seryl-tRNA synthetase
MINMAAVEILIPGQFIHENNTWLRLLEFFKQENAVLKNRLAEVLDYKSNKEFLVLAEHFQNLFIIKDEFIDELRHDVNSQVQLLSSKDKVLPDNKLVREQKKLRNEMEYLEKDFAKLKNEFNRCLSTHLHP